MSDVYQFPENPPGTGLPSVTTAVTPVDLETFLQARGLDPELGARLGLTESGGFIEIPFCRNGVVIHRKYRGISEKKFTQDEGCKPFFWNIDVLSDESLATEPLILTEGEFDAMAAIQAGFPRVMSVPNGAPMKEGSSSMGYVDEVEEVLRKIPEIILAFDEDGPGINLQHDFVLRLGKARCKWLKYPKGCKDLNDALRLWGPHGVRESIRRAQWVKVDGVHAMKDLAQSPYRKPLSIGIPGFEPHVNLRLGDFWVVTGIPGHGKTAFVSDVVCRVAVDHGLNICMAPFEEEVTTDLRRRLRTWHGGKMVKDMSETEKAEADEWINRKFMFLVASDEDDVTMEWMMEKFAVAVVRYGANVIVVDPWNEMDHLRDKNETMTEYTGRCIKEFKRFCRKYGVTIIVIAHPAKMERNRDGIYPTPNLYNISDSAHWYNKADVGLVVHRGEDGDFVRIAKTKHHSEIGKPGDVGVFFSQNTGRYTAKGTGPVYGD